MRSIHATKRHDAIECTDPSLLINSAHSIADARQIGNTRVHHHLAEVSNEEDDHGYPGFDVGSGWRSPSAR
ncbi:hypothetical protein, partial [Burkholderia pseudomallei]|uniref:hypothetical protein n=1 Tax=Burkholderia pseudomallei TaxID=28450 RepID=UPI001E312726